MLNLLWTLYISAGAICFTTNILYSVIAIVRLKKQGLKLGNNKIVFTHNLVTNILMSLTPFFNCMMVLNNIVDPNKNINAFEKNYVKKGVFVDAYKYNGRILTSNLRRSGRVEGLSSIYTDLGSITEALIIDGASDKQIIKEHSNATKIINKSKKERHLEEDAKEMVELYAGFVGITREQAITLLKGAKQFLSYDKVKQEQQDQKTKKLVK